MSEVLFCGGQLDGVWLELPQDMKVYRRTRRPAYDWLGKGKVEVEIEYDEYRIWDINILGWHMRVGSLVAPGDMEGVAVLKAVVQRDVAARMLTGKRYRRGG